MTSVSLSSSSKSHAKAIRKLIPAFKQIVGERYVLHRREELLTYE
jgi:hypothetical protein